MEVYRVPYDIDTVVAFGSRDSRDSAVRAARGRDNACIEHGQIVNMVRWSYNDVWDLNEPGVSIYH